MSKPTITCTRRIQFCAGHRLLGHESKCAHLHGHNYVALFEAKADDLDDVGRVVDFSVLKDRLGGWVEANWDHGFICNRDDDWVSRMLALANYKLPNGQRAYRLPCNPTAENLASYLGTVVAPLVLAGTGVRVVRVTLWETENCFATWEAQE